MPLNLGPDHRFGSALSPNFEPDFGQVLKSSGSNCSSKLDWGSSIENNQVQRGRDIGMTTDQKNGPWQVKGRKNIREH